MANAQTSQVKVALVTGAGRGIGRAIALRLAELGTAVGVLARNQAEVNETVERIRSLGGRAHALIGDVTTSKFIQEGVTGLQTAFGPVDALVNNAGSVTPFGPLWETSAEEWWRTCEVNLRGSLLCAHAVLPEMVRRRQGRIVNIASGVGTVVAPYFSSYVTSKTALIRFTECLALETKPFGVAAFSISPGTVRTKMSEYSLHSAEGQKWLPWFGRIFDQKIDVPVERPVQLVCDLLSGRFDALSGRMLSIFDDLETLRSQASQIEQQNLYSLKVDKLPGAGTNPALSAVLAAARGSAKGES